MLFIDIENTEYFTGLFDVPSEFPRRILLEALVLFTNVPAEYIVLELDVNRAESDEERMFQQVRFVIAIHRNISKSLRSQLYSLSSAGNSSTVTNITEPPSTFASILIGLGVSYTAANTVTLNPATVDEITAGEALTFVNTNTKDTRKPSSDDSAISSATYVIITISVTFAVVLFVCSLFVCMKRRKEQRANAN